MTNIDRRTAALMTLLSPLAAGAARAQTASARLKPALMAPPMNHAMPGNSGDGIHWLGDERIAMLMYPGMTIMDLIWPQSMFASMMGAKVMLVAKTLEPVTSDAGVTITLHATFDTLSAGLDGAVRAGRHRRDDLCGSESRDYRIHGDRGARAKYVTSVCSGSLILGKAGLLKGYRATSHWSCRNVLAGFGAISTDARVVRDRNRFTGAGVPSGLDFGLPTIAEPRDRTYAECTQLMSEDDPRPPFNAGSLKTARAGVKAPMIELIAGSRKQADALAANG